MTMKIDVKNDDSERAATIIEEDYTIGNPSPTRSYKIRLAPKESRTFYIHASKQLIIKEIPGE